MNEIQIILIGVMSIIGTIINVQLLNHNWFKRQELKSKYKVKEIRERSKAKLSKTSSQDSPPSPLTNVKGLLNLARGLEPDQIHDIVDTLTGNASPESSGDMLESLISNNPELVQSFIDGLAKGKQKEPVEQFYGQNQPRD